MRIAIVGFNHETNTYCQGTTPLTNFHRQRGDKLLRHLGTDTSLGGALQACADLNIEPVPIFNAMAQPSGVVEREAYDSISGEILHGLSHSGSIDAVFLDLHGAGVVEGIDDLEGALCESIRLQMGDTPIAATFDLHGNVTPHMVDQLDGVFVCHQYPHIDLHLRAAEAIQLLASMVREGAQTALHIESLPMLMPTTTTFEGIGKDTLAKVLNAEQADGIVDISWFHGFPYTDVPQVGVHVVVTTSGDKQLAAKCAREVADSIWSNREAFRPVSLDAQQALAEARASNSFPVVINETSDNCGGGSPGDGTHLLKAMLDARLDDACFGFLVDSEVALQAHRAGVGADIQVSLGGKTDDLHGLPLTLNAYVKALHDGKLTLLAMFKGSPLHLGPMARLVVDGMDIVVASKRSQTFDIGPFAALGIDVTAKKFVALKSSSHFRAGFGDLAAAIVTADTPGLTTHHIEVFERNNASAPLWPIDSAASYD